MTDIVLTPTGERPEAFVQCVAGMMAQTHPEFTWIIVDDGRDPMQIPHGILKARGITAIHVRPPAAELWQPGMITLGQNLVRGLKLVDDDHDRVAIVEDDDHYAPDWLATAFGWLGHHDLVGESESLYVHLNHGRVHHCRNTRHASLCSTAFKGRMIDEARAIAAAETRLIDIKLWSKGLKMGCAKLYPPDPRRVTGVKGYPGRPGIGVGHRIALGRGLR